MADESEDDEGAGILALVGAAPKGEDSEDESSPKARAMKEMSDAMKSGNWEAAGHAFQRAYDICRMKRAAPEEPDEDDTEEEY